MIGDLGTYLMSSALDLMGADGALTDVGPAAAARSFMFTVHCLYSSVFIHFALVLFFCCLFFSAVMWKTSMKSFSICMAM